MDDAVQGLRERGLPLASADDLTPQELARIHQYVDGVFREAARELLDMLAARIRRDRGLARGEEER